MGESAWRIKIRRPSRGHGDVAEDGVLRPRQRIKHLVVYAFSTENWNRDTDEVSYLMGLFSEAIRKEMNELGKENVRVRFARPARVFLLIYSRQ